jgi:hypothetical protein
LITVFTVPLFIHLNFTAIGHFSAIFIGLLFYPMARGRGRPPLNPADVKRSLGRMAPTSG